jgi:hypothetical protein
VKRFGIKGKLAPRYIGPFPISEKLGVMAYKLELLSSLASIHNMFHVSKHKKFLKAPIDVFISDVTPLESDLSHPNLPVKPLDH